MVSDRESSEFDSLLGRLVSARDLRGLAGAFDYASSSLMGISAEFVEKLARGIREVAESMFYSGDEKKFINAVSGSEISDILRNSLMGLYHSVFNRPARREGEKGKGGKGHSGEAEVPMSAFAGGWKPPLGSPFVQFLPIGDGIASEADLFGASRMLPKRAPHNPLAVSNAGFGGECIVPKKKPPSHTETRRKMMAFLKRVREKGKREEGLPLVLRERSRGRR
jgi:hypothetical protein